MLISGFLHGKIGSIPIPGAVSSDDTIQTGPMRYWAMQYGTCVEILEPESLRKQIIADIKDMKKRYSD